MAEAAFLFAFGYSGYRLGTDSFVPKECKRKYNNIIYIIIYNIYYYPFGYRGTTYLFTFHFRVSVGGGQIVGCTLYPNFLFYRK